MSVDDFDHALPFLLFTTLGVLGMIAVFSWVATYFGLTGLLGFLKGGTA